MNVALVYPLSAGKRREPGKTGWFNKEYDRMWMNPAPPDYKDSFDTLHDEVIAILADDWRLLAAWTERPSSVQAWFLEKQKTTMQQPLHDELLAWYEKDSGKTTVLEIADLLER